MALIVRICSTTVAMPVLLNVCRKFLVRCSDVGVSAAVFGHHGPCSRARAAPHQQFISPQCVLGAAPLIARPCRITSRSSWSFFLTFHATRREKRSPRAAGQARGGYCPYSCPLVWRRRGGRRRRALRCGSAAGRGLASMLRSFLRLRLIRYRRLNNVHMVSTGHDRTGEPVT